MTPKLQDPVFRQQRGPVQLTATEAISALNGNGNGRPPILVACGAPMPDDWSNKGIIYLGIPGAGKTLALKAHRASLSPQYRLPGWILREFLIDPTGTFWNHASRTLPPGVPMLNLSPHLEGSRYWDVARETNNEIPMLINLVDGLMGVHEQGGGISGGDPFWPKKARVVILHLMMVFAERAGFDWTLADVVRALWFPEFLAPILAQSATTRGSSAHEITGKMGKGITATASAELNQLAMVAAFSDSCKKGFTFREQFARSVCMHLAFDPTIAEGYGRYAATMAHMLYLTACKHGSELNRTFIFADELREMRNMRIPEMLARGRQFGLSLALAAQGIEGLVSQWGDKPTREMLGLMQTIVAFASTPDTSKYLCDMLGKQEGIEIGHTVGDSLSEGKSSSYSRGGGRSENFSYVWNGADPEGLYFKSHRDYSVVQSPHSNSHPWVTDSRWIHTGSGYSKSSNWSSSSSTSTTTGTSNSWSARVSLRDAVVAWDLTGQKLPDWDNDELDCILINRQIGFAKLKSRWRHVVRAERLRPHAQALKPKPASQGVLRRFTREDLQRLGLELTDDLSKALNS